MLTPTLPTRLDLKGQFPPVDRARWLALVESDLQGAPFERKLVTHTYEGLYVRPLYTRQDDGPRHAGGLSGVAPMVRGAEALGTSVGGWDLRQERAEADPAAAHAALRDDLEGGVTSVLLRLDACGRAGLDARDDHGSGLAARDGVAAYTLDDLEHIFQGVYLDMIGVALEAGAAFVPASALLAALWEKRGVQPASARGAFNADPLAVLARDGLLPQGIDAALKELGELAAWTHGQYAGVRAIRVGTAPYHHAGATATQDLAFSMATALEYLRASTRAGLSVDEASGQMVFSYAVGCQQFLAIAKLRAARALWSRIVLASGGTEAGARMMMHARPSKRVMASRDPWVNILRNTTCVFAAGVAGAQTITSAPFDAPLGGEPSALARRLARNTHHVLMEECHAHAVCDLAGGSWYIETLTRELAEKAWVILQSIESRGGMLACLRSGWVHEQIDAAAQPRLKNLSTRKDVVVGVSDFPGADEKELQPPTVDRERIAQEARRRLAGRDAVPLQARLGNEPTAAWAMRAALAGASIAELARGIWEPFNLRTPTALESAIHVHPFAEPFERLRDAADDYARAVGHKPRVFLAAVGSVAKRLARVNFCMNLFQAGGFEVLVGDGSGGASGDGASRGAQSRDEILAAFRASGATLAVVCGDDADYQSTVHELVPALHAAGANRVVLAGNPGANESAYRQTGVDHFVFVKCDVVSLLRELLASEGVEL
ncbi:MAG: methylmalonyl-CoA mutase family protein [Planctomycetota bacterium]|nr:methylmalonyl-CoA mutase family protein [Planctomycetota bacterium]